ncbi:MAG: ATP-binding cassette domain-containing protein, partial [Opitutales bacterium]|nr:ATP-binding cassette domain-containing protein [Opitutales bacterium]
IALLGANGNGKSTPVKVLADRLPLLEGTMTVSKKLNRAYFSQQLTDQLDIDKTPYEFLSSFCVGINETAVRSQLARFGLTQQKADTLIRNLSGGEKTRLLLAITTRHGPHVLILDEPTNHLDIEAKEALVDALNAYEGAVVLVSHDFFIVESVCEQLWLVKDQKCVPYDGDLEHYVQDVLNEKRQTKGNAKSKSTSGPNNKQRQNLEKQLGVIEQQLSEKQQQKAELERRLNEQYSEATLQELTELSQHIEQLEANWLELSEQSEA